MDGWMDIGLLYTVLCITLCRNWVNVEGGECNAFPSPAVCLR